MHRVKYPIIKYIASLHRQLAFSMMPVLMMPFICNAQYIPSNGISVLENSSQQFVFDFSVKDISVKPIDSVYVVVNTPAANSYSRDEGKPMLPQYCQIISLPIDGDYTLTFDDEEWQIYSLEQLGCDGTIVPSLPARPKNEDAFDFKFDTSVYGYDTFWGNDLVRIEDMGVMRGVRLARLTVSPVRYNPVGHSVAVCRYLSVVISYSKKRETLCDQMHLGLDFDNGKEYSNQLIGGSPYTYMVVAPPHFRHTLQPFVSWKRQEGYAIEEFYPAYNDKNAIKAFLQHRYDNATSNFPAPLFILLVGDVQDIQVWPANFHINGIDVHRTDLYYAEYTGDYMPDALLGRISVRDTATLAQIISKTIKYERFEFSDSGYLGRSLLVAGKEEAPPAPTVTNGQINYLKSIIIQHDSLHDTVCFYNPSSDTMSNRIQDCLRQGVGFVNYTAHCTSQGWRHPLLSSIDIDSLSLGSQPFLSINNCCRVNDISGDCFGEHLLQKAPGGAVGVIGASNETLWDEDYFWSVGGSGIPSLYPQYSDLPGAYDRLFHINNEPVSQRAVTQSQIVLAGNWAVSESGSPYDGFYWEIYSLLGDPSLMPYIGVPASQQLEIDSFYTGDIQIVVHGTPGARVAATYNDTLYGVCTINDEGNAMMTTFMSVPDSLLFTATAQYHKPIQKSVRSIVPDSPRIVVTDMAIQNVSGNDIDRFTLCDSAVVIVTVRNVGSQSADGHSLHISAGDADVQSFIIASLMPGQDTIVKFTVCPKIRQEELTITFETADSVVYWSHSRSYDVLVANTEIMALKLMHDDEPVSTVLPTTTYEINAIVVNRGIGVAKELKASIEDCGSVYVGDLDAGDTAQCIFDYVSPDEADSVAIAVCVSHRADTIVNTFIFAVEDTSQAVLTVEESNNVKILPNPADDFVIFSGLSAQTHIVIYDIYGRKVKDFFAENGSMMQYSTRELRCGIYHVMFYTGQQNAKRLQKTAKLVIAR